VVGLIKAPKKGGKLCKERENDNAEDQSGKGKRDRGSALIKEPKRKSRTKYSKEGGIRRGTGKKKKRQC